MNRLTALLLTACMTCMSSCSSPPVRGGQGSGGGDTGGDDGGGGSGSGSGSGAGTGGGDASANLTDDAGGGDVDDPNRVYDMAGVIGMAYSDLGTSDSGACVPGSMATQCAHPIAGNAGCQGQEDCGMSGSGNGLDDDCNGLVDDTCGCVSGSVEKCFLGPPGKHAIGACTDGTQTCTGGEFGAWGPCMGSISPSPEACDAVDNDCDGCVDDGLCCGGQLACPTSVPNVNPYTDVTYDGGKWFMGGAKSWTWTVAGGPCDRLFAATTNPVVQSYTVTGANTQKPKIHFTLSGDYTVTMTAIGNDGLTYTCTFVQHVVGPGVRFELCWDHTGPGSAGGADLDLHVHKPNSTTNWFSAKSGGSAAPSNDDCNYQNCTVDAYGPLAGFMGITPANWGYAATPLANCVGAPASPLSNWMQVGACKDPRLDMDNIDQSGRPENTNIDNPKDGDSFRAMVHYYGQDAANSSNKVVEHPMVNVYCGGNLVATFGQAPDLVSGFDFGDAWNAGQMWRVADVKAKVDMMGNTTGCTVTALHPAGMMAGYYVTKDDTTY